MWASARHSTEATTMIGLRRVGAIAISAGLLLPGCTGGGATPSPADGTGRPDGTPTVSIERIQPSGERVGEVIRTRTINVDNCAGSGEIAETLSEQETITVSIEQIDGNTLSGEGTVNIGAFGSVGLGAEIASEYGLTYGQSTTVADERVVTVPPGSSTEYAVEVRTVFETGTITLTDGGQSAEFPYEILTGISVDATGTELGCSFLGSLQGTWSFRTWRERTGQVTLYMAVLEGLLVIDAFGHAAWDLVLDDGGAITTLERSVRCLGVVDETAKTLAHVTGRLIVDGEDLIGEERNWGGNLASKRGDANVAFCGSTFEPLSNMFVYDTTRSDYELTLTTAGDADGTRLLTMRNAAGTFTWEKAG
jgi:hypothetical protein